MPVAHRKNRTQVRQIVADRLRLKASALLTHPALCELHQLLPGQHRVFEITQPSILSR